MSEQLPNNDPFVPPPPPSIGNPIYPPHVLAAKAAEVASETRTALILSVVGLFCFGFIFGLFALRKANDALDTIAIYDVAQDKRSVAMTAKVLGIIDIIGWVVVLVLRIVMSGVLGGTD